GCSELFRYDKNSSKPRYEKARLFTQAGLSEYGKGARIRTLHDGAINPAILKAVPSQFVSSKLMIRKSPPVCTSGPF
ncbi:hypothetical protein, partial [Shewanella carassii]|uniref:hypothetical protein n=1 Tax=Shewanella carassii TaxID=1987584 RepID=UPI00197DB8EF